LEHLNSTTSILLKMIHLHMSTMVQKWGTEMEIFHWLVFE
jgi:hypothetical protein